MTDPAYKICVHTHTNSSSPTLLVSVSFLQSATGPFLLLQIFSKGSVEQVDLCAHTHTQMHTHTHSHGLARKRTRTLSHGPTHTHTRMVPHADVRTHTHTFTWSHTHTWSHAQMHTTHTRTLSHGHTHTHTLSLTWSHAHTLTWSPPHTHRCPHSKHVAIATATNSCPMHNTPLRHPSSKTHNGDGCYLDDQAVKKSRTFMATLTMTTTAAIHWAHDRSGDKEHDRRYYIHMTQTCISKLKLFAEPKTDLVTENITEGIRTLCYIHMTRTCISKLKLFTEPKTDLVTENTTEGIRTLLHTHNTDMHFKLLNTE